MRTESRGRSRTSSWPRIRPRAERERWGEYA
jgi:hypothetical protein